MAEHGTWRMSAKGCNKKTLVGLHKRGMLDREVYHAREVWYKINTTGAQALALQGETT